VDATLLALPWVLLAPFVPLEVMPLRYQVRLKTNRTGSTYVLALENENKAQAALGTLIAYIQVESFQTLRAMCAF